MQDDVIGIVDIRQNECSTSKKVGGKVYNSKNNYSCIHFDKQCMKELDCERIVFDRNFLTLHEGTICDNKTHKITNSRIQIDLSNIEESAGQYEMVKEGNGYKLYKI